MSCNMKRKFEDYVNQTLRDEEFINECFHVLPDDLMEEIMARLPVKSLLRFKSVSKAWKYTIISPNFIAKHLIHQKQKKNEVNYLHLLENRCGISLISKKDHNYDGPITTTTISPFPKDVRDTIVSIVGSSNGLVCFVIRRADEPTSKYLGIWNPSTRKFTELPYPPYYLGFLQPVNTSISFSYIPSKASFKLATVSVFEETEQGKKKKYFARVQVFNKGENCWREVLCYCGQDQKFHDLPGFIGNNPQIANGCLYWIGSIQLIKEAASVLMFDLEKEVFRETDMPYTFNHDFDFSYRRHKLSVFGENLVMIKFVSASTIWRCDSNENESKKNLDMYFEVWKYEGTNKSWTKQIMLENIPNSDFPIGNWGTEEIVIRRDGCSNGSYAYLYNYKNKEMKSRLCHEEKCSLAFYSYVESLVEI